MNYSIIYSSNTGNTRMLADTIASELKKSMTSEDQLTISDIRDIQTASIAKTHDTVYFIGFWTDKGTCSQNIADFLQTLNNCRIFLFGTAGFGQSQEYFDKLIGNVSQYIPDSCTVIGTFMCQGKMPQSVRTRYEKMLADKPEDATIQNLIQNFDQALTHPDDNDKHNLINTVSSCIQNIH